MEEGKFIELIPQDEFEKKAHEMAEANLKKMLENFEQGVLYLRNYMGVSLFKSVRRAIRRGHISVFGDIYPRRPFNNRKRYKGTDTYNKRRIYESITHKKGKIC
ncbi:MAG: hypothetical protein IJU02_07275 [Lachnospiraceae bacterium]|nr:hypothetical protein [Lachnospiraceae bacterium]